MFGLNKYVIIGIAAAILIGIGTVAVYQWRSDIMQVAYDKIFRKMAENELKEKEKEIKRLSDLNTDRENAIRDAIADKIKAEKAAVNLGVLIRSQTYNKEPVSPGLTRALEAIQDYGRSVPPQNSGDKK